MNREEREEMKLLAKQIAMQVINDYNTNHSKPIKSKGEETAPDLKDKARELLKKCDQKYQKNVLDKLVDND